MVGESALCYPLLVIFVAVAGDGPGRVPAAGAVEQAGPPHHPQQDGPHLPHHTV